MYIAFYNNCKNTEEADCLLLHTVLPFIQLSSNDRFLFLSSSPLLKTFTTLRNLKIKVVATAFIYWNRKCCEKIVSKEQPDILLTLCANKKISGYQTHNLNLTDVISPAIANEFYPHTHEAITSTKNKFANGSEFFLHIIDNSSLEDIVLLLSAFSLFKKWHRSNMQLLLVHTSTPFFNNALQKKIATYKYKIDIRYLENVSIESRAQITSAAYAVLYPFILPRFLFPIKEALQSHVPCILLDNATNKNLANNAALYIANTTPKTIFEKMSTLYKDENLHYALIINCIKQKEIFAIHNIAKTLRERITTPRTT